MIAGFEQHRNQTGIDLDAAVAQPVQHVFDDVREADNRIQAEQACRALDGVRRTEDRADGVIVAGLAFQLQQRLFHRLQQLASLDDESL